MKVYVSDPKPIPEGYTYTRCDQYTSSQFKLMYRGDDGEISPDCIEYMKNNPKKFYTVDDRIAIRQMAIDRAVGSMIEMSGRNTTKRYRIERHWE